MNKKIIRILFTLVLYGVIVKMIIPVIAARETLRIPLVMAAICFGLFWYFLIFTGRGKDEDHDRPD